MAHFALVPAAGTGARMGGALPKQYLPLAGRPLIHHALAALAAVPEISRIYVVLAPDDTAWDTHDWSALDGRIEILRCGGDTRADSVTNGLRTLRGRIGPEDWVLVHDAARACITPAQVARLIAAVGNDPVGGILAVPLADTLKQAGEGEMPPRVRATVPRDRLWQAQTPQMFRHGMLLDALEFAPAVTDEASALEALGLKPQLVEADASNFKVTRPFDLQMAAMILRERARTEENTT